MSTKTKIYRYIITTNSLSNEELAQRKDNAFTFEKDNITINFKKTISATSEELATNPSAINDNFIQSSTHIAELIAVLHTICFENASKALHFTIYFISADSTDYDSYLVELSTLRLPDDFNLQISLPVDEANHIISILQNEIGKENLKKIEREIAVFVDFHYADNTSPTDSPTERFLSFWSAFNAIYTTFADKHMKPTIDYLATSTDFKREGSFSDLDEIFFISSFPQIDKQLIEKLIYILRNNIIHGNTFLPILYSSNPNYSSIVSDANRYSLILREYVSSFYYLCLSSTPETVNLLDISKRWIEKKIAAMKKKDDEKAALIDQINGRYQDLTNPES